MFASYAAVGDVNLAEPNALIGFAGARVNAGTIAQELPPGFQRAEFLFSHGFVDRVVARSELKRELAALLRYLEPVEDSSRSRSSPAMARTAAGASVPCRSSARSPTGCFPRRRRTRLGATERRPRHRSRRRRGPADRAARDARDARDAGRADALGDSVPIRGGRPWSTASLGVATARVVPPVAEPPIPADPKAAMWARVQLARNLRRPRTLELVALLADDFVELHGDRLFGDDEAVVAGFARIDGRRVVVIGQQKGADTDENLRRNFGMPHPEGYRKAMRIMDLAERFGMPIVTFVDVPGAHPGPESEERGIAEAIASSVGLMSRLRTPIVTIITGEGGSGGALAIAVGDVVIALENAVYSVISPEGCAAILWRSSDEAATAALAMRMSADDQHALGVVDHRRRRAGEGAHSDHAETAKRLKAVIVEQLERLSAVPLDDLVELRYQRYRAMGTYGEEHVPTATPLPPTRGGLGDRLRNLIEAGRGRPLPLRCHAATSRLPARRSSP